MKVCLCKCSIKRFAKCLMKGFCKTINSVVYFSSLVRALCSDQIINQKTKSLTFKMNLDGSTCSLVSHVNPCISLQIYFYTISILSIFALFNHYNFMTFFSSVLLWNFSLCDNWRRGKITFKLKWNET